MHDERCEGRDLNRSVGEKTARVHRNHEQEHGRQRCQDNAPVGAASTPSRATIATVRTPTSLFGPFPFQASKHSDANGNRHLQSNRSRGKVNRLSLHLEVVCPPHLVSEMTSRHPDLIDLTVAVRRWLADLEWRQKGPPCPSQFTIKRPVPERASAVLRRILAI